jgi:hypothetical protein
VNHSTPWLCGNVPHFSHIGIQRAWTGKRKLETHASDERRRFAISFETNHDRCPIADSTMSSQRFSERILQKTSQDLIKLGEFHRCFWLWNDGLKATHHPHDEVSLSYWPPIDQGMAEIDYIGSNKNMALGGQEI